MLKTFQGQYYFYPTHPTHPTLKRYGNNKGYRQDKNHIISGLTVISLILFQNFSQCRVKCRVKLPYTKISQLAFEDDTKEYQTISLV
jgi:hypothetical protein